MVKRIYLPRKSRVNDPEISFTTLEGACRYRDALGIPTDEREGLILEVPVFVSFELLEEGR